MLCECCRIGAEIYGRFALKSEWPSMSPNIEGLMFPGRMEQFL